MKVADQWWRDQVIALFPTYTDGRLRRPQSKEDICDEVCRRENLSRAFPSWPYIERAVRQLRAEGKLAYSYDWQGWHVPEYEALRAEAELARERAHEAFMKAHEDRMDALAGRQPRQHGREGLIARLQAKADSSEFPAEAAAFRAKIAELKDFK